MQPSAVSAHSNGLDKDRVLVVDDEPQVLLAIEDLLSDDYSVVTAQSGPRALELVQQQHEFAVVLSDQRMPAMTGAELLERVQDVSPASRILFTGFADLTAVIRAVNHGKIFAYVTKPWQSDDLRMLVRRAVEHFRLSQELRTSEERLRLMFGGANIGLWDWNLIDQRVSYSPRFAALLGCEEEALGEAITGFTERVHPADAPQLQAAMAQHLTERTPLRDLELRIRHDSGEPHWFQFSAQAVWNQNTATRMVGSIQDIHERKLQEERIARLTRIHEMLSGINTTIVRVHERQALLRESCRIAVHSGKLAGALAIGLGTEASAPQLLAADDDNLAREPEALSALIASCAASAPSLLQGQALVLNDAALEAPPELARALAERGVRALALLPLMAAGALESVFVLFAAQADFFDAEELGLLRSVCDNISFALDHGHQRERLDFLAYYDELTSLPKRDLLMDRVSQLLAGGPEQASFAVILLEVGRFRHICESLGRRAGDTLLVSVAERLKGRLEPQSTLARFDAHCFALLLPRVHDEAEVAATVESVLLPAFDKPFLLGANELHVGCRVGIALAPSDGESADSLMSSAEAALEQVGTTGRRYLFCAPGMTERAAGKLALETKLRSALEHREFVLHYQPKVELKSGRVVGLEALLRWQDPSGRLVSPGTFIPVMEETGLIVELGHWALQRAAEQFTEWSEQGVHPPPIAVNVSAIELGQPSFLSTVDETLRRFPLTNGGVDLEITESVLMEDLTGNIEKLKAVRERGLRVAIDDFGTGYSSLGYLSRLPVDALKIDRSFVIRMGEDPQDMTIVMAIISLAHAMDLKVIAEGTETSAQTQMLRLLKCDQIQGYFFARPQSAVDVVPLLGRRLQLEQLSS
jgi:diguanylate cyclase (GGDEF)-like protein/PAS domain S-box-containing protein